MSPTHKLPESNPTVYFALAKTKSEIDALLQDLARNLLFSEEQKSPSGSTAIDLMILQSLPISRLLQQPHPLTTMAAICRLLCKKGDVSSLRLALGLAHKIYGVCRARREGDQVYYLYKGIAEIGLGMLDIGIKNVSIGQVKRTGGDLHPMDQCLGHWALMSAAVQSREIHRAIQLAEKWRQAALKGRLRSESCRASLALQIFHLLLGDQQRCLADIGTLAASEPGEWQPVVAFLQDWTAALLYKKPAPDFPEEEPYPLFLGLDWKTSGPLEPQGLSQRDFAVLCQLRRAWCDPQLPGAFSVDQLVACAELAATWELPQFLWDIEAKLKIRDCDKYLQFSVGRVLGKTGMERLSCSCSVQGTEVVTLDKVIVWVMDVRGYTRLAEHWSPEQNFTLLSPVFKIVHEELEEIGGRLLEFAGDCIIIAFNTPSTPMVSIQEVLCHTTHCLHRLQTLNTLSLPAGSPEVKVGIGIDRGAVALGFLGGLRRCHHSVLGRAVNRAARIEGRTKALDRTVLVSTKCFDKEVPDVWKEPQMVNFSVRNASRQKLRHVSEPLQLVAASPLLEYWVDFVPMGFVAFPEPGVVYIDTGNSSQPGVIDHHFQGDWADSACELLMRQPELLLDHLQGVPGSQIEFRLHQQPDLDCAATLYAAVELLHKKPRRRLLEKLAAYVSEIDQGKVPNPENLPNSLYGIFLAHQTLMARKDGQNLTDLMLIEAQLRVIDAALFLLEKHRSAELSRIFQHRPEWFSKERDLILRDMACYQKDLALRSRTYKAYVNGRPKLMTGLWLDHPQSILFKQWVRNDQEAPGGKGFSFLTVDWSQPGKNRFLISVDPESSTDLKGLGELLEAAEEKKRQELGLERPVEPKRYPSNNSDPWYFGWGHGFTIIDSPREGTVLTAGEVRKIHEDWRP